MKRTRNLTDDAFDERGLLKPGRSYRVPVMLMDGAPRDLHQHSRRPGRVSSADGDRLGLHRPGWRVPAQDRDAQQRYVISDSARQRLADSRAEYENRLVNAWRGNDAPPYGAYPFSAANEGKSCTIDGRAGTLVKRGNWLVCVANKNDDDDDVVRETSDARSRRKPEPPEDDSDPEDDYDESDDDYETSAEQITHNVATHTETTARHDSRSVDQMMKDHSAKMEDLYRARDRELESQYRGGDNG